MNISNKYKEAILLIDSGELTLDQQVTLLLLIESNIEILTISKMARKEGKTPRGIRTSNQYRKETLGGQLMAIKGLTNDKLF